MSNLVDTPVAPPVPVEEAPRERRKRRSRRTGSTGRLLFILATLVVAVWFILGPVITMLAASFQDTGRGIRVRPPFVWTTDNFTDLLTSSALYENIANTAIYGVVALLISFSLSTALAWAIERTDIPFRNVFFVLVIAPVGIPGVVFAISWSFLLNPTTGLVNTTTRAIFGIDSPTGPFNGYSLMGMAVVQGLALVPLTFLLISPSLIGMNRSLEDAARASGAGFWSIVWRVVLPLWRPALLAALIYEVVTVIEDVDIPIVLGLPGDVSVFMTDIYTLMNPPLGLPNYGAASAMGTMLVLAVLLPLIFYNRMIGSGASHATLSGKSFRPARYQLGRWRVPATIGLCLYVFISFVLPVFVLLWGSTQPYMSTVNREALNRATLSEYASVLWGAGGNDANHQQFIQVLKNTLIMASSAALATLALGVMMSWIVVRSRSRFRVLVDVLAFTGHAMPAAIIGVSVLIIYLALRSPIYGTIWIIVIAMIAKSIALATRSTTSGMTQIQLVLEEAAETSGASTWQTWRRVVFPLMRPTLVAAFLLLFVFAVRNLTLPLFLNHGQENAMLASFIYFKYDVGDTQLVAVLCVLTTAITLTLAMFLRRFTGEVNRG